MWPLIRRPKQRSWTSEDWQASDVAECVQDRRRRGPEPRPRRGERAIVLRNHPGQDETGQLGWGLELLGWTGRWDATAFRNVPPPVRSSEQRWAREAVSEPV